jgi:hypothetical protein
MIHIQPARGIAQPLCARNFQKYLKILPVHHGFNLCALMHKQCAQLRVGCQGCY